MNTKQRHILQMCRWWIVLGPTSAKFNFYCFCHMFQKLCFLNQLGLRFLGTEKYTGARIVSRKLTQWENNTSLLPRHSTDISITETCYWGIRRYGKNWALLCLRESRNYVLDEKMEGFRRSVFSPSRHYMELSGKPKPLVTLMLCFASYSVSVLLKAADVGTQYFRM
jgi:hypothetical protein